MDPIKAWTAAMETANASPDTITRRTGTVRRFAAAIQPTQLGDASPEDVETFLRQFSSAATRKAYLGDIRAFYRWAVKRRLHVGDDPTAELQVPKVRQPLPRPIGADDLGRALMAADDRIRLILLIGALAGLRRQEIAGLHGEDISDVALRVRRPKGGRERMVPLHPVLRSELARWGVKRGPLFPHPDDPSRPISRQRIGRLVSDHFDRLGIEGGSHRLRHRAATSLADVAQDAYQVAAFLGHQSLDMSLTYVASNPARLAANVARLPDPRSGAA